MMILKLKSFHRWAKREKLTDKALRKAVDEIIRGLVDVELGGGLLKKRVAREGKGKRGGFRMMLAFRRDDRSIFMLGYPKNAVDNIGEEELSILRQLAKKLLHASDEEIKKKIAQRELIEVK